MVASQSRDRQERAYQAAPRGSSDDGKKKLPE